VTWSLSSVRNEKIEYYIRIKTHCLNVLGWEWCQCLMWLDSGLIGVVSPKSGTPYVDPTWFIC